MPNLNDICHSMTEETDYALAAAIVDQDTGLLLGVSHNASYFTQSFLDAIAATSVDLFRGKAVGRVEQLLAQLKNEEPRHSVKEIQLTTEDTYHFMTVVPDKPNILAVLVTSRKISLGMGWAGLRSQLKEIAEICP